MTNEELDQLVRDYEGLFHRVLQRCGIFPGQETYEDDLQELRLLFFLRAQKYPSRGFFEMENNITLLFRYLLWRLVDTKRKKMIDTYGNGEELFLYLAKEEEQYQEVELLDQLNDFYLQLSQKDREKCQALLSDETLSRQNRSRYRNYFSKHFKSFFKKV